MCARRLHPQDTLPSLRQAAAAAAAAAVAVAAAAAAAAKAEKGRGMEACMGDCMYTVEQIVWWCGEGTGKARYEEGGGTVEGVGRVSNAGRKRIMKGAWNPLVGPWRSMILAVLGCFQTTTTRANIYLLASWNLYTHHQYHPPPSSPKPVIC